MEVERQRAPLVLPLLAAWLVLQIVLPLRHLMIPGEVSWTEEGHRFSWHMKLRDKYAGRFLMEIDAPDALGSASNRYRDVDAIRVPWEQLPELVVTYEPIVGERVIFNPLSKATWSDAVAAARHRWSSTSAEPLQLQKTRSLESTLGDLDRELRETAGSDVAEAEAARRTLEEVRSLHAALVRGDQNVDLMHLQFRFQDALRRLVQHRSWRKRLLAALWQTPPFACQGATGLDAPFMVVANRCVLLPDDHACCRIDRAGCPALGDTLIDLHQLTAASLRSLPEAISFADFEGRPAVFWNYSHELHAAQIESLQISPLLQHAYAQHVATRWQQEFGGRPRIYVTSYVKLNQHVMQPLVDPEVDLAHVPRQRLGHHAWILPLERSGGRTSEEAIARRNGTTGT
jgi:hypothetical protein